jgi:ribosome-associated translation inhibitor RaiA
MLGTGCPVSNEFVDVDDFDFSDDSDEVDHAIEGWGDLDLRDFADEATGSQSEMHPLTPNEFGGFDAQPEAARGVPFADDLGEFDTEAADALRSAREGNRQDEEQEPDKTDPEETDMVVELQSAIEEAEAIADYLTEAMTATESLVDELIEFETSTKAALVDAKEVFQAERTSDNYDAVAELEQQVAKIAANLEEAFAAIDSIIAKMTTVQELIASLEDELSSLG